VRDRKADRAASGIRGVLLDIEGTIVADKAYQPVGGAVEFVGELRDRQVQIRLVTNNTTDTPETIHRKLRQAGFELELGQIITCTTAAIRKLRSMGLTKVLVVGTAELKGLLRQAGIEPVGPADAQAVLVGLDEQLTYASLQQACEALVHNRAVLVGLHHNRLYKNAAGRIAPSVGPIVEALAYAAGVEPAIIGKPSEDFFRQALADIALDESQVLMVSDDPLSDLAGAKRLGMPTAFVLTGKYPDRAILARLEPSLRPDIVANTIADLLDHPLLSAETRGQA